MIDTLGFKARQAICGLFGISMSGIKPMLPTLSISIHPQTETSIARAALITGLPVISGNIFEIVNSALNTLKEKTKAAKYFSTKHFSEKEFSEKNVLAKKFQKVISAKKFQKNIFAQKMFSKSFAKTCKNFFKAFFQKFISAAKSFYPAKKYDVSLSKRFFGQNIFAAANRNA